MSFVFDYAKGRHVELADCPRTRDSLGTDNLLWVLLQLPGLQTDANLGNHQYLADITAAGNLLATFTNYAPIVLTRGGITISTNTGTGVTSLGAAVDPVVWPAAGGAQNNDIRKMLLCYRGASTDTAAAIRPLLCIDASGSTSGQDFKVDVPTVIGSAG